MERIGGWLAVSLVFHAVVLFTLAFLTMHSPVPTPPVYRVNIVAAPPGPRAAGVVVPTPQSNLASTSENPLPAARPTPEMAPLPKAAQIKAPVTPQPKRATPVPPTKPAAGAKKQAAATPVPKAGGGPQGGQGTDVANVQTAGVDFPFPGYLNNIVRQVALNFSPDDARKGLRSEVAFLIRKDGTVTGFRFVTRSGDYGFDLEAQGAIEKAGPNFGPLPDGFTEDVLPVLFSFDPRLIR